MTPLRISFLFLVLFVAVAWATEAQKKPVHTDNRRAPLHHPLTRSKGKQEECFEWCPDGIKGYQGESQEESGGSGEKGGKGGRGGKGSGGSHKGGSSKGGKSGSGSSSSSSDSSSDSKEDRKAQLHFKSRKANAQQMRKAVGLMKHPAVRKAEGEHRVTAGNVTNQVHLNNMSEAVNGETRRRLNVRARLEKKNEPQQRKAQPHQERKANHRS